MAGINHVTGKWWWIPGTRGFKRGCPMKDGKIDNKIIISWNRNQVFYLLNSSDVAYLNCVGIYNAFNFAASPKFECKNVLSSF